MTEEKEVDDSAEDFTTKNLDQAAFIWCQDGVTLRKLFVQKEKSTIVYFTFNVPSSIDDISLLMFNYANELSSVEPLRFCHNQNKLRDFMHMTLSRYRQNGDKNV